jgi:hypothetical protein
MRAHSLVAGRLPQRRDEAIEYVRRSPWRLRLSGLGSADALAAHLAHDWPTRRLWLLR